MATSQQDRRPAKPQTAKTIPPATVLRDVSTKPAGDQTSVQATASGDQTSVKAKGKKKHSPTFLAFRDLQKAKAYTSGNITITDKGRGEKPKAKNALAKFRLYRDGMSVAEYIEASHKFGTSKATAQADIRWDVAKGLIEVK